MRVEACDAGRSVMVARTCEPCGRDFLTAVQELQRLAMVGPDFMAYGCGAR